MKYVFSIIGMVLSVYMIKQRETIGDMLGEADWMRKVGGIYIIVVFIAILLFFYCVSVITGTQDILLRPLLMLFPGATGNTQPLGM